MIIGIVSASLSIPEARSLKDKRSAIRSLKDRILNKMNVSVAEVGKQDSVKQAEMAFVTVAATKKIVDQRLSGVSSVLQTNPRCILIDLHTEIL